MTRHRARRQTHNYITTPTRLASSCVNDKGQTWATIDIAAYDWNTQQQSADRIALQPSLNITNSA